MKVFVTGATGFVGRHLVRALHQQGAHVYWLARSRAKAEALGLPGEGLIGNLENLAWAGALPADLNAVVHTAGLVHSYDENSFFQVNTEGTRRLLERLRPFSLERFIFISSLAALGPADPMAPWASDARGRPVSSYGASKAKAEQLINQLPPAPITSIVRPPIVIGPEDEGMLEIFKMIRQGRVFCLNPSGAQAQYSFIAVDDLVRVIASLLQTDAPAPIVHAACERPFTMGELAETCASLLGQAKPRFISLYPWAAHMAAWPLKAAYRLRRHNLRLTPDKVKELAAEHWVLKADPVAGVDDYEALRPLLQRTLQAYERQQWR